MTNLDKHNSRKYPKELVRCIFWSYLTHKVLGYKTRQGIMVALGEEFDMDPGKVSALITYETQCNYNSGAH